MKTFVIIFTILFLFSSCNSKKLANDDLNKDNISVKDVDSLKSTVFLTTLEHKIPKGKNAIYAATMLFAWNEIKQQLNNPIIFDSLKLNELKLLNNSKSFLNTLNNDEMKNEVKIQGLDIIAKSFFQKSLLFENKFTDFNISLDFQGKTVKSFGLTDKDPMIEKNFEIMEYKNDSSFIIKLLPTDKNHEIILILNDSNEDILEILQQLNKKKSRLSFEEGDKLIIPNINFNLDKNYNTLVGNEFECNKLAYVISKAYQQISFKLDRGGAEVQSKSEIVVSTESARKIAKNPKNMIFNKPFLVLLKRKDNPNPYFYSWIENSELMLEK